MRSSLQSDMHVSFKESIQTSKPKSKLAEINQSYKLSRDEISQRTMDMRPDEPLRMSY